MEMVEHSNWGFLLLNYIYCSIEGGEDTWIGCNNLFDLQIQIC